MKRTYETMSCSEIHALIEAYLDQELMPEQVSQIESHLRQCSTCAEELQLAEQVCNTLRVLPAQYCPDHVKETVLEQVRGKKENTIWKCAQAWLTHWHGFKWRPAFANAVLVALLVAIGLLLLSRRQQLPPTQVSPEELAQAEIEVKWALAYLGEISQRTGITIRDGVIGPRVVAPLKQAIEQIRNSKYKTRDKYK